jgi:hypothetical protein
VTVEIWTKILIEQYDEYFIRITSQYEDFSNPNFLQNLDDCYKIVFQYIVNTHEVTRKLGSEEDQAQFKIYIRARLEQMFIRWKKDILERYHIYISNRQNSIQTLTEEEKKREIWFINFIEFLKTSEHMEYDAFKQEISKKVTEIHIVTNNIHNLYNIILNIPDKSSCGDEISALIFRIREKERENELLDRKLKQRIKELRDASLEIAKLKEIILNITDKSSCSDEISAFNSRIRGKEREIEQLKGELERVRPEPCPIPNPSCEKRELDLCQANLEQAANNISTLEAQINSNDRKCSETNRLCKNNLNQCHSKEKDLEVNIASLTRQIDNCNETLEKVQSELDRAKFLATSTTTTTTTTTTPSPLPSSK